MRLHHQLLVPNCPRAKLSVFTILVPNCLGTKLSSAKLSGAKLSYHPFGLARTKIRDVRNLSRQVDLKLRKTFANTWR